jgi:hypothetical protein
MLALLLLSHLAHADTLKIQRPHFYCLSAVAKLGDERLRPVGSKEGRGFVLAKVDHSGTPGYYLVDMGTGTDSTVSFLDRRLLGAVNHPDVKESFPPELLTVLKEDAKGVKASGDAAKFGRPQPVKNESAYAELSRNVIEVLKAKKTGIPDECHAFGDLIGQLTDEAWAPKPGAAKPAKK